MPLSQSILHTYQGKYNMALNVYSKCHNISDMRSIFHILKKIGSKWIKDIGVVPMNRVCIVCFVIYGNSKFRKWRYIPPVLVFSQN